MRFIIQGVQCDDSDGSYAIMYLDKQDALRRRGAVLRTHSVVLSPDAGELYKDTHNAFKALLEVLEDVSDCYKDEAPFIPEEEEDEEEDDDEKGLGW